MAIRADRFREPILTRLVAVSRKKRPTAQTVAREMEQNLELRKPSGVFLTESSFIFSLLSANIYPNISFGSVTFQVGGLQ